jgi:lipid-A-disaccharide synthase-like uncharacterized protein
VKRLNEMIHDHHIVSTCPVTIRITVATIESTRPKEGMEMDQNASVQSSPSGKVQRSTTDVSSVVSVHRSLCSRGLRLYRGAVCRRTKLSPDDISVDRYSVAAAHLFLYMTMSSLILAATRTNGRLGWILPNLIFHILYTLCYALFLCIYAVSKKPPGAAYVSGVALYFVGYGLFLVMFILQWCSKTGNNTLVPYAAGSTSFLIGSMFLVYGTFHKRCYTIWRKSSSLFWGSVSFLVGSVFFSVDSIFLVNSEDDVRFALLVAGLTVFSIGRAFFLCGSTTNICDVVFRDRMTTSVHEFPAVQVNDGECRSSF